MQFCPAAPGEECRHPCAGGILWQRTPSGGHEVVIWLLLEKNIDCHIHAQGGHYGNALQVASARGHEAVVQLLPEKNTDIHSQGGYYGNMLQAVLAEGHERSAGCVRATLRQGHLYTETL